MGSTGCLSVTVLVTALWLISTYHVQGSSGSPATCKETCEKYRIVDLAYTFSCSDLSHEPERSNCQESCHSCKEICDDAMVEKIYNCPDIHGKMPMDSDYEGAPLASSGFSQDTSLTYSVRGSRGGGRSRTATEDEETAERRKNENPEKEYGAANTRVLIWVALVFILLIVIVGGIVMFCVLCGPRRRNRDRRRDPEVEAQHVGSGSDESVYYPVIPPETQVVLRPSEQY